MTAGFLAGALLGALDLFTMTFMARKAAGLGVARVSRLVRWGTLLRFACIFTGLLLGAATLRQPVFLRMAGAYVVVRLGGLFVIVSRARASANGGKPLPARADRGSDR
ncbi:MAG: hypothetical protein AB1700_18350 [Bacillota bacterium]